MSSFLNSIFWWIRLTQEYLEFEKYICKMIICRGTKISNEIGDILNLRRWLSIYIPKMLYVFNIYFNIIQDVNKDTIDRE
jgi:hypothetical protein